MARDGAGTYDLPAGQPVVTLTTISSSTHNTLMTDIATALTASIAKDGQTPCSARIPFANGIQVTTDITTPSSTFSIANTTATTVNFAGAASTALNIGHASGTNTLSGILLLPNQPLVLASADAQANVTGDNTAYTILWANEIADRGSNFASPTFTAPKTGLYRFGLILGIEGMTTHTRLVVHLVTTNRTYVLFYCDGFANMQTGYFNMTFSQLADMTAADTASVTVTVAGGAGTKVVDISAIGANNGNYFSVELVG